jgi:Thioredoxin
MAADDEPRARFVRDDDLDVFGAEDAAARLSRRLAEIEPVPARFDEEGRARLSPPFTATRDRVDGPPWARTLVVFGAHATPWSRRLGDLLSSVRDRYRTTVRVVWRHDPDPVTHPRAVIFALAAEAAAPHARFWALTRELLRLRHHDPPDLHAAIVRAGLYSADVLAAMRAGAGADRIAEDVASARASGVAAAPALFIDGVRYEGELDRARLWAALDAGPARIE